MERWPEILDAFEQALELERELGTRTVECDRALLLPPPPGGTRSRASATSAPTNPEHRTPNTEPRTPNPEPRTTNTEPRTTNHALPTAAELTACTRCDLHGLGRTHVVPGQGNANGPDFMFVGEAPGADEDRQGLAFVGAAGQFLTKMIAAMGYTRDQVFIANICKCRPPNNRAFVRRGQWQTYEGIPAIGTFHPAYILRFDSARDPAGLRKAKLEVWDTLKLALARLGKKPPEIKRKGQTT